MTMPKVWNDYDRLDAADLNADFAYLLGRQGGGSPLIGVLCPAGAAVTPSAGTEGEVFAGTPVAGDDPAALYVAGTKRVTVPVGYGGLWQVTAIGTASGGTTNDLRQTRIAGLAPGSASAPATLYAGRAASAVNWSLTAIGRILDGVAIQLFGVAFGTGATFTCTGLIVVRLAPSAFRTP